MAEGLNLIFLSKEAKWKGKQWLAKKPSSFRRIDAVRICDFNVLWWTELSISYDSYLRDSATESPQGICFVW